MVPVYPVPRASAGSILTGTTPPPCDAPVYCIGGFPGRQDEFKLSAYPIEKGQAAQPAWLAFDRQVLRFYGHYQETVQETNGENQRYRYCTVLFYLEDDTIQVNEKCTDNSGLNQGTIIRRHRIPKPAPNDVQQLCPPTPPAPMSPIHSHISVCMG